ncbi:LacI family DNA-binding transcriptional regulator [Parvularcula sp. LCG005]|uniref:LacI family DNA-binding transcriptional regulator n=1 Tax=Parvularcula sp. LCG005 TaxID=3078805 RepID=UPI0029424DD5|nr:LacI family DNA-binding transcriptional regulator [Parvularcula sp. LCG005]WOI52399.1 LacI family DNA-binding transcriptional regulator [Parvularcula sp. LCG005]
MSRGHFDWNSALPPNDNDNNDPAVYPDEQGESRGKVTINDVARLARVSKKTVSRVINNSPLVRDDTRERVQAVIRQYGYAPDPQARALAFRRSFLVGMIYDNPSPQYVVNMQRGILDGLEGTGHLLVLQPCDRSDPNVYDPIEAFVRQQKPRGVILTPSISEDDRVAKILRDADCPYVRIASVPLDNGARMLRTRDHEGAKAAALHIAALGHRRIGHVHGPSTFRSAHERRRGFEEGLAEHGLTLDPALMREGAYTFESGAAGAASLLAMDDPPTALFMGNDEMAVGAYQAAREAGLSIPEDVSIVGYDDTPMASRVYPPMTTVRTAIREMGAEAARQLLGGDEYLAGPQSQSPQPELVIRGSTAQR